MYGCESWAMNKAGHWRIDSFELWCWRRLFRGPLRGCKIKPVNLKGNQPWIFIGKTDAEVEAPVFWSSDGNSWFTGKILDAGKDWGQKEKRMSEDEMAGWHHWCNGHELGQTPGDGEGQAGLACYSPQGHKESDMTGQLNNNNREKGLRPFGIILQSDVGFIPFISVTL